MEKRFQNGAESEKYTILKGYLEAIKQLHSIELPQFPYGNIVQSPLSVTDETWQGFLLKNLDQRIKISEERLQEDVFQLEKKILAFRDIIQKVLYVKKKNLIHGDYYMNQILIDENNNVSAILDMSMMFR